MNDIELLDLISKGNTEEILMQKNLTQRLNSLTSIGIIDVCEGNIKISQKGDVLLKERNNILLQNIKMQKEMEEFSYKSFKRNSLYVYLSLMLLCCAAILLFILITRGI